MQTYLDQPTDTFPCAFDMVDLMENIASGITGAISDATDDETISVISLDCKDLNRVETERELQI